MADHKSTHNCGQLRLAIVGEEVKLVGWYENLRKVSKNLGFLILRDFYGTTQIVISIRRFWAITRSPLRKRMSQFCCHLLIVFYLQGKSKEISCHNIIWLISKF